MNNLYQTWVTGGSYAIALDSYMVKERKLNKPSDESSFVCEWVDLGLPSGMLWANRNIGAAAPEEFGLYFAWGETQGYGGVTIDKQFYWDNYKFVTEDSLTKYNNVDGLTILELEDDAAYQMDNSCRMPTKADFEELTANTTSTWETLNGVYGRRFTSKTNGNSIFIPASGFCRGSSVYNVGYSCYLWTSSLYVSSASKHGWDWYFNSDSVNMYDSPREIGNAVRAVKSIN